MDKLAELARESEIRGAMAAFVDAGLVKVAGQREFDALVGAVCRGLGDEDYDLQKVAAVTDAVLSGGSEDQVIRRNAALGELMQLKIAGQIDDAAFEGAAGELLSKVAVLPDILSAGVGAYRASGLTRAQRDALLEEYHLPRDASLDARNAGRGWLGVNVGALGGGAGLGGLGYLLSRGNPNATGIAALLGSLAGAGYGAKVFTDKYAPGNADRIIRERQSDAKTASDNVALRRNAALGELMQLKIAGQIDDATFEGAAGELLSKEAFLGGAALKRGFSRAANKTRGVREYLGEGFKGTNIRKGRAELGRLKDPFSNLASHEAEAAELVGKGLVRKGLAQTGAAYGGTLGALGLGGYGLKRARTLQSEQG